MGATHTRVPNQLHQPSQPYRINPTNLTGLRQSLKSKKNNYN